jgi:drug/metabolite transporter (DMT)-like permease
MQVLLLVVAVILLNAFGNLLLTWGLRHVPEHLGLNPAGYIEVMANPFTAVGIAMLILWMLTRMTLMSWADLSFVLPVTAAGYMAATLLGCFVLHEAVSPDRWAGSVLILAGAVLVGLTTKKHNTSGKVSAS